MRRILAEALAGEIVLAGVLSAVAADTSISLYIPLMTAIVP
jgi:hypothetical protein